MDVVIGVDTSCYTTSVAAVALDGTILADCRRMLSVPAGERGLRQSEGLYAHVRQLPELTAACRARIGDARVRAVAASVRPRPEEASFMPVFLAGAGVARAMAAACNAPFFEVSHQQGHVRAALVDSALEAPLAAPLLSLHISGGTTEVLLVEPGWGVRCVAGGGDLPAGQFVDRVGVALGLPFPAGPHLEALAGDVDAKQLLPAVVRGGIAGFSGAESQAQRWIEAGEMTPAEIAAEVYGCLERAVFKMIEQACCEQGVQTALLAGGVAASKRLRAGLLARAARRNGALDIRFGRPELSSDNAVGVALLGLEAYLNTQEEAT